MTILLTGVAKHAATTSDAGAGRDGHPRTRCRRARRMRRKLASDCDGDVIAAGHAIKRTLRSEGHIDALAEGQRPNGALTEAEIRKLYDAGLRAAEEKHRGAADF